MICIGRNLIVSLFVHTKNLFSKLSTLTNLLTKLPHIASFCLCQPSKNNGLSNCSPLTLVSVLVVKSCCSAFLLFDTDQNRSISTGKGWSKPEIIVSIHSTVALRLYSLALMLFFCTHQIQYPPDCSVWKERWMCSRGWWKNYCIFLGFAFLLTLF